MNFNLNLLSKVGNTCFNKIRIAIRAIVFLLLLTSALSADRITLKNGRVLEGKASRLNDSVIIEIEGGSITIRQSDIQSVESALLPKEEFAARLKQAQGNCSACIELARWAWQKDLKNEYGSALRAAIMADPASREALRMLQDFQTFYAQLADNPQAASRLLADLGPQFRLVQTEHYLLATNASDLYVDMTARRLEKLYGVFMRYFSYRGFVPAPLAGKLEVVLFQNQKDFRAHAATLLPQMTGSAGFYYSKTGRSYFYDIIASDNDSIQDQVARLQEALKQNSDFRQKVKEQNDDKTRYVFEDENGKRTLTQHETLVELDNRDRTIEQEYNRIRTFYYNQNAAVTIHEGTHQLAWQCGIHSKYSLTPKWLAEGLAVYFESPRQGDWHQPGELHEERLKTFCAAQNETGRLTLAQLIARDDLFETGRHNLADEAYASAWALFYYLAQRHHDQLFDYLFELSARMDPADKPYSSQERLADFRRHFGSVESFEKMWRADLALLKQ